MGVDPTHGFLHQRHWLSHQDDGAPNGGPQLIAFDELLGAPNDNLMISQKKTMTLII